MMLGRAFRDAGGRIGLGALGVKLGGMHTKNDRRHEKVAADRVGSTW
jgi:hypothetical protein